LLLDREGVVPALALAGPRQVGRLLARRRWRVLGQRRGPDESECGGDKNTSEQIHGGVS
jgi:hypothetical protein